MTTSAQVNLIPYDPNDYTEPFYRRYDVSFEYRRSTTSTNLYSIVFRNNYLNTTSPVIQVSHIKAGSGATDSTIFVTFTYLARVGTNLYQ
jgi:hypothetical protein